MSEKRCIALLLAGGKGTRLGIMTEKLAKPVMYYGGKYRIIDFTLSNCSHSGVDTVGVLTQYEAHDLHSYIGDGAPWSLTGYGKGAHMLPSSRLGVEYTGTADAVFKNIAYVDKLNPKYVLILSGDHVYKMDYGSMIDFHASSGADITIAGTTVPHRDAHLFGIMETSADGKLRGFEEKPREPKSTTASMGVYAFTWKALREALLADEADKASQHDFGKNVIPKMLAGGSSMYVYMYDGYWKDVGTVPSYWESNMDLLADPPKINLFDPSWLIYSRNRFNPPNYIGPTARISHSIVSEGCTVHGGVSHTVMFAGAQVQEGAVVQHSILMPGSIVLKGAHVNKAIVGPYALVGEYASVGVTAARIGAYAYGDDITVIGESARVLPWKSVESGANIKNNYESAAS